jgi:hypothetical protein
MQRFERADEATDDKPASDRLEAFTQAIYTALVPESGACVSMQGELVRAIERICSEALRNGMMNYYEASEPLADNYYGALVLFVLATMIENRGSALDAEDVAYFVELRRILEPDRARVGRLTELEAENELSEAEERELEQLLASEDDVERPAWEWVYNRAQRCVANWCIANPSLIDREGNPVVERGIRDITAIVG